MKYDLQKRIFSLESFYEFGSIVTGLNLWGYLKTVVYNSMPIILEDLH